ncbi:MAG: hypothetical protein IPG23_11465 [Burkholderiales bacterium]|nr:hypothetical protein [Burkholderiales bacterium]
MLAHPVASRTPLTQSHQSAVALRSAIEICELDSAKIIEKLRGFEDARAASNYSNYVEPHIPTALFALVLMFVVPPVLKVFFFYVLAPLASGRPPLVIDSKATGKESSEGGYDQSSQIGAVSQSVKLTPSQELLVHSDYLQTTPLHAKKSTKWLLNNKLPLSSLSSGMYMLTLLECSTEDPIVVSSTKDNLSEVGIIELPEGAAFVCQPRSLVGGNFERDRPIYMSKHWHIWSLQSWLTLQLRFIVFHGPGRLLIKGNRGIRMETACTARLLSQNATLGFSANLKYANTRCETFVSYWAGKESLFHDLFTGSPGVYVYEEVPAVKAGGVTSFVDRFVDAGLNAFGI